MQSSLAQKSSFLNFLYGAYTWLIQLKSLVNKITPSLLICLKQINNEG